LTGNSVGNILADPANGINNNNATKSFFIYLKSYLSFVINSSLSPHYPLELLA